MSSLFSRDSPPPTGVEAESSSTPHRSRAVTPVNGVKEEKDALNRVKEEDDGGLPGTAANSRTGSPVPGSARRGGAGRKKASVTPPPPPKLIDDLPLAWDAAHETFETLERCVYETKRLGLSREQDEMMVCDCVWDRGQSGCAQQNERSGLRSQMTRTRIPVGRTRTASTGRSSSSVSQTNAVLADIVAISGESRSNF